MFKWLGPGLKLRVLSPYTGGKIASGCPGCDLRCWDPGSSPPPGARAGFPSFCQMSKISHIDVGSEIMSQKTATSVSDSHLTLAEGKKGAASKSENFQVTEMAKGAS